MKTNSSKGDCETDLTFPFEVLFSSKNIFIDAVKNMFLFCRPFYSNIPVAAWI